MTGHGSDLAEVHAGDAQLKMGRAGSTPA
jgi:hypothetical protein